jgi:hypothetical protein
MIIQPIVEGEGDFNAIPVLLRRICYEMECGLGARIATPMMVPRSKMVQEECFKKYLRIANSQPGCKLILLFMDADDDCVKDISERLHAWIDEEWSCVKFEIIVIPREFECWFIAALESLRGVRGISIKAKSHPNPESVRNPKEILTRFMKGSSAYHETADQAALTDRVDLSVLRHKCRAFSRLIEKIESAFRPVLIS